MCVEEDNNAITGEIFSKGFTVSAKNISAPMINFVV